MDTGGVHYYATTSSKVVVHSHPGIKPPYQRHCEGKPNTLIYRTLPVFGKNKGWNSHTTEKSEPLVEGQQDTLVANHAIKVFQTPCWAHCD